MYKFNENTHRYNLQCKTRLLYDSDKTRPQVQCRLDTTNRRKQDNGGRIFTENTIHRKCTFFVSFISLPETIYRVQIKRYLCVGLAGCGIVRSPFRWRPIMCSLSCMDVRECLGNTHSWWRRQVTWCHSGATLYCMCTTPWNTSQSKSPYFWN